MLVNDRSSNWTQLVPVNNILPFTPRTVGLEGHEPRPPTITETTVIEELISANEDLRRLVAELALSVFQLRQSFE
ncbi:MAG TPA: hypothetical protein VNQ56_14710 [Pseudolabrys sp.]|nr:hypothetical protein [Pseudolabrys sp.]